MKHFGDITKINGTTVPIVDIVCGGSPCQDLSLAGKRAGLNGERSGLFMEQIRIIKEMREHDARTNDHRGMDVKPRYMVWENVPGALSSGTPKGEDFRIVLEETAKVAERDASIPGLEKWPSAGCIMGNGWSIAWRVHDAQFWGVPQRRRRIALVADFGGQSAPEILFEREGVSGNSEQGGKERKDLATSSTRSVGETISFQERAGKPGGVRESLSNTSEPERYQPSTTKASSHEVFGICSFASNSMLSDNPNSGIYKTETSRTLDLNGGSPACNQGGVAVVEKMAFNQQAFDKYETAETAATLTDSGGNYGGGTTTIITQ